MLGSEHVGPEVGTSRGRYGGEDLGHAGAYDECYGRSVEVVASKDRDHTEGADDDPPDGHDSGPTRVEAIGEET